MQIQKSDGSVIPKKDRTPQEHPELIPSAENELVANSDEADLLNDRTPAGDMGPEESEIKRGPTNDEASY